MARLFTIDERDNLKELEPQSYSTSNPLIRSIFSLGTQLSKSHSHISSSMVVKRSWCSSSTSRISLIIKAVVTSPSFWAWSIILL